MTTNAPTVEVFFPEIKDRSSEVAFISRCALAYGYEHDPAKVRAGYLSYEAKRGAKPPQLAIIEKDYDATYQAIGALGHRQNSFCATKDGEQVRSELRRLTSGYFDARPPTPTTASIDRKP